MTPSWLLVLLCSPLLLRHPDGVVGWGGLSTVPSESECRPYIEKALKEHNPQEAVDTTGSEHTTPLSQSTDQEGSIEETEEATTKQSTEGETGDATQTESEGGSTETGEAESTEENLKDENVAQIEELLNTEGHTETTESTETQEDTDEEAKPEESTQSEEEKEFPADQPSVEDGSESTEARESLEATPREASEEQTAKAPEESTTEDKNIGEETKSEEENTESTEQEEPRSEEESEQTKPEDTNSEEVVTGGISAEETPEETPETIEESKETKEESQEATSTEEDQAVEESTKIPEGEVTDSAETPESTEDAESKETTESTDAELAEEPKESVEDTVEIEASAEETTDAPEEESQEEAKESAEEESKSDSKETSDDTVARSPEASSETTDAETAGTTSDEKTASDEKAASEENAASEEKAESEENDTKEESEVSSEATEATPREEEKEEGEGETTEESGEQEPAAEEEAAKESEPTVEDQLTLEFDIPKVRRPRDHITEILRLSPESAETEMLLAKTIETTLKELKKHYDSAIQPLEILFKYRDLSNRHFGDPEIFSKPLILFMGPWSGGKSTILNYLLDNEFKSSSLRTGAEPSPAYFNIVMWGEREEVLDGTQLAADWTFSGLQKFGQGLLDRLRGLRLNHPLLEKVNIVEIPGILEIRKQVARLFPFNDACQWFIDRADIIFLVYDPSKLDVGPETEAILDQLKGREYQTRIILNKADQVKPEELMRVQGTLIWNISPLMSSQEPPVMYSTSLWSIPYEQGSPSRLLHAQERAFLRDLRTAIDKRVENKIASARRFAVRVRNHAKMVDCYLTTYYNHKTFFGNRKKVADDIIEHPQNYHIYEGLSTLTNISRYDLPDPEVYRDFFRLNPLYDFQRLSDTCTYFRGCPINRLDRAIAYDLPELVGKYKKQAEKVLETAEQQANKS